MDDEYTIKILKGNCLYCNEKNPHSINGIDRLDSDEPYSLNNCVSCCTICNHIKNTQNLYTF